MIWLLLACTEDPVEEPRAPTYLELLDHDPRAALAACSELENERERGDCTMFAAIALGQTNEDALPACLELGSGWVELCVLEYSDAARLTGEAAEEACPNARQLHERCISHAISREVTQRWREMPRDGEADLLAWTEQRMVEVDYASIPLARERLAIELVSSLVSHERMENVPQFGPEVCGTLPDEACSEGMRQALRRRNVSQQACTRTLTDEVAASAGLPLWHEDLDDRMARAWELYCAGVARPKPR